MLIHQLTRRSKIGVQGGKDSRTRHWRWLELWTIIALCILSSPAYSQTVDQCNKSTLEDLNKSIRAYNDDKYRTDYKFENIWYFRGPVSEKLTSKISLETIKGHLAELGDRKSAVLFHSFHMRDQHNKFDSMELRTWLITSNGRTVCASPRTLTKEDLETIGTRNWNELGRRGARQARAEFEDAPGQDDEVQRPQWATLLERLSEILLPTEVVAELTSSNIDTLVVVPSTMVGGGTPFVPEMTLSLSTIPFAALPFNTGTLIDKFSIVISPGFVSFEKAPKVAGKQFRDPIVVGNPVRPPYPDLPGAEDEAKQVAERLGSKVFVRESAEKKAVEAYLRKHSASVDLIHLATHGIADANNPLEKSFLVLSDSLWTARQISKLKLTGKPLVVMSACQTALGKDFLSGTIGLAQAWHKAGASNVVMSLWSVDDTATKALMGQFVDLVASGHAVDKALQVAMVSLRHKYPNPSHWASFSVYGAPERIGLTSPPSSSQ